jgi:hypothetical protein
LGTGTPLLSPRNLEFRAEFYNAFNTPSFSNPILGAGEVLPGAPFPNDAAVGVIAATSVAPRISQLALKLNFWFSSSEQAAAQKGSRAASGPRVS